MGRRVGIFGGTFDPIHLAHLILVEEGREALGLDQILLMPAAIPPHKQRKVITPAQRRFEMVELAVAGNAALAASDVEIKRTGVSYTVDTLRQLHTDSPTDQFLLLLGADSLIGLPNWREPEEVVRLAKIAVARRPGESIAEVLLGNTHSKIPIEHVEMPLIDISSTRIRQRCAAGRSIRYLVPAAVEAYIHAHGLYAAAHEDENIGHSPTHD